MIRKAATFILDFDAFFAVVAVCFYITSCLLCLWPTECFYTLWWVCIDLLLCLMVAALLTSNNNDII